MTRCELIKCSRYQSCDSCTHYNGDKCHISPKDSFNPLAWKDMGCEEIKSAYGGKCFSCFLTVRYSTPFNLGYTSLCSTRY